MKFKKRILALTLSLSAVLIGVVGVGLTQGVAEEEQPSLFEETYKIGTVLNLPENNLKVNGKEIETTTIIVYPDGQAREAESVNLTDPGKYTVYYRGYENGKVYKESYEFLVPYPAFHVTGKADSAVYDAHSGTAIVVRNGESVEEEWSMNGLLVKLAPDSVFTSNEIIDLKTLSANEPLFSYHVVPTTPGQKDAGKVVFKLTDVLDPTNYVTIQYDYTWSGGRTNVAYILTGSHNQPDLGGIEDGYMHFGKYGFPVYVSMDGSLLPGGANSAHSFYLDPLTMELSTNRSVYNGAKVVADLDGPKYREPWDGFTSGKIRLSAYFSSYSGGAAQFLFTKIAQTDLTAEGLDVGASDVVIDYGEYDENNYPSAVVGKPYKIFDAKSLQLYTEETVAVNVYTSYATSFQKNVKVVDGCFIPDAACTHTIEYTVTDRMGNTKKYAIPVKTKAESTPITFNLDQSPISLSNGVFFTPPEATNIAGGNGNLKLTVTMKNKATGASEEVALDGSYRVTVAGDYELIYKVADYNTEYLEKKIDVTVIPATQPYFLEKPELPKTYIVGAKYELPMLKAEDLTGSSVKNIVATTKVATKDGAPVPVSNGVFTVPNTETLVFTFTAIDSNKQKGTVSYEVNTTNVNFGTGDLAIEKYFLAEGGTTAATSKAITFTPNMTNAKFEFIREIDAKNLQMIFNIASGKGEFSRLRLSIRDWQDADKALDIVFYNQSGYMYVALNDNEATDTGSKFSGMPSDCIIRLQENVFSVGTMSMSVAKYANGEPFEGFNDFTYLTISMEGVKGAAEFSLVSLNSQILNDSTKDVARPNVFITETYGGERDLGENHTFYPIYALDVLDPYAKITFSVTTPSGKYLTTPEGLELRDVPSDRTYKVVVSEYGNYNCTYTYQDSSGNGYRFSYFVTCMDKVRPQIAVEKKIIGGKVNQALSIPSYQLWDNDTPVAKLKVYIQIIDPFFTMETISSNETYKPLYAGTYTIRYMVIDGNYNLAFAEVTCIVTA